MGGRVGGWGGLWLIFPTEYVTTKPHAKNQLIWTNNGREMAVWSFFRHLEKFWAQNFTTGPTSGPPSDFSRAGLGSCDTPLEPYGRWLQEYAKKCLTRQGWRSARDKILKKSSKNRHFFTLGPILGGFPDWVRVVSYPVGTASSLASRICPKLCWHDRFLTR